MPLIKEDSDAAMHNNIKEMVKAGHPIDQAVAAAYHVRREAKGKKK